VSSRSFGARQLALFALAALISAQNGCRCTRDGEPAAKLAQKQSCTSAADCETKDPCSSPSCMLGQCSTLPAKKGQSCDNDTVCDGVATCDGEGHCLTGPPPAVDDGNACTSDSCDKVRGVRHEPVTFDDFDVCTADACDPKTGSITHASLSIDDHDDCTFDACDPKSGVTHQRPNPFYTCSGACGAGFHPASRAVSQECGSPEALRTFCVPDCGSSFHACAGRCPGGYHSSSRALNPQCGERSGLHVFCQKTAGPSFYTCDEACPAGYQKRSQSSSSQCGGPAMAFCAAG
jgi:hypothetical protein